MSIKDTTLVAAGTFLVIIGAYMSIFIGPVPIVLTNFFLILVSLILGYKKSFIIIITYIIIGAIGLPVFSGGKGGVAHILGLTGGFIIGFIPLAIITGFGYNKGLVIKFILAILGSAVLYLIGVPWAIYVYNNVIATNSGKELWDLSTALKATTIPYLIPDLIKIIIAVIVSKLIKPVTDSLINSKDE